jgi:hypothetical protein
MNVVTHELLDGMVAELICRGLPADYARRAAAEFDDHHRDLVEELKTAGRSESQALADASARLGDTRTLIKKKVREYQRRHWCGRWPLATFFLGPIPLLFLTWVAISLAALCIIWPLQRSGFVGPDEWDGIISTRDYVMAYLVQAIYLFAAPAVVMFVLARLARRAALNRIWIGVAACMLALFVSGFKCEFADRGVHMALDGSDLPADRFCITVGLDIPSSWEAAWQRYRDQLGQILVPMAIAAAVILRGNQLSLRSQRVLIDGC